MSRLLLLCFLFVPFFSFSQLTMIELEARPVPEPTSRDSVTDAWNLAQPGYQKLPDEAKQLFYWTNYARNNPQKFWDSVVTPVLLVFPPLNVPETKSLQRDLTRIGALPMFTLNGKLVITAQLHASDIAGKNAPPGHTSTKGVDFSTRIKRAGIRFCANENIAVSSQSVLLSVLLLYLDIGLPELGHRKALLDPNLREIGVGSASYKNGDSFLVQDLACAQQ